MQQEFDWSRAEQLGMIERWTPPRVPGVSAASLKHVLRAIDAYGRGREAWPSEATLARDCGLGVRTVKRAIKALGAISLLIVQRRGPHTVNHYRIVWTELALRCRDAAGNCPERSATAAERSATRSQRSATATERSATMAPHEVPPWHPKRQGNDKETTTNVIDVVVVDLEKVMGRAAEAVTRARERGLADKDILERYRQWQELPANKRLPGVLYNWLAKEGSYRAPADPTPRTNYGRGDGMSRDEVEAAALRVRIVRAGRAAGATAEQIEQRLHAAGV